MSAPLPLTLDTDAGSDVDDLLAVAVVLGSPELRLRAVTTVYGDTARRARIVSRTLRTAGRPLPPIAAGRRETRSGQPVWWAGYEGALMADLDAEPLAADLDAVDLLRSSPRVVAIGPLTNLAEALAPGHSVRQVTWMGGNFGPGPPEHNASSDADATAITFAAGVPVTVVGYDQTTRVPITPADVERIDGSGPLGRLLAAEVRQYWAHTGRSAGSPHDPVALLTLVRPDLFRFAAGTVEVDEQGATHLVPGPGPHRVAVDLDPGSVAQEVLDRVLRAARSGSGP